MLDIVLFLLKIIGILILAILGLILTIVVLVLLVPIRYHISASYHESLKAGGRVSWLLRLISVFVTYDKELEYRVKILGFTVFSSDKQAGDKETDSGMAESAAPGAGKPESVDLDGRTAAPGAEKPESIVLDGRTAAPEAVEAVNGQDGLSEAALLDQAVNQPAEPAAQAAAPQGENVASTKSASPKDTSANQAAPQPDGPQKQTPAAKLQAKFTAVSEKAKALYHKADRIMDFLRNPDNQATFKLILRQVKAILKHLLPQKLKADVVLGFDDPATTGQVLSVCSLLYMWYDDSVNITPVFEESVLEGDVELKGRIRLGTLAASVIRVLLNKNFRILLKRWRVNGGILDG